jgi:hypothetical protein
MKFLLKLFHTAFQKKDTNSPKKSFYLVDPAFSIDDDVFTHKLFFSFMKAFLYSGPPPPLPPANES